MVEEKSTCPRFKFEIPVLSKTANANTARFTNKRKLSKYENDIEDVRPDPSIPYIPPAPKKTTNGGIIDARIFDGANQLINEIWMVPRTCNAIQIIFAIEIPCESCAKAGRACIRDKGLVSALLRGYRLSESGTSTANQISAPSANSSKDGVDLLGTGKGNIPKNPKKRPRTAHKLAKAREAVIEPGPTIVEDFHARKPPCIGRPPAWCDSDIWLSPGWIWGLRDYIDGRINVAHEGGKSGLNGNGKRVLLSDQTIDDAVIKSMLNNMRDY
ncbi:hypothetical protein RUND412_011404 [Rhizina undulata]